MADEHTEQQAAAADVEPHPKEDQQGKAPVVARKKPTDPAILTMWEAEEALSLEQRRARYVCGENFTTLDGITRWSHVEASPHGTSSSLDSKQHLASGILNKSSFMNRNDEEMMKK